jgi:ribosomal protein S18 acetylase RimI-like enzyme
MAEIREYKPRRDKRAVIDLVGQLQDSEKTFDKRLPAGSEVKEAYFEWMRGQGRKHSGKIFVAEADDKVVGFISVLGRMKYPAPDDYPHESAFVTDLIVLEPYRGRGIGRMLLSKAEDYARELGVHRLQLEVTFNNSKARRLYSSYGFENDLIRVEKKLQ